MSKDKIIVITGPTGVGKTELSLQVCQIINGEVINCDASQMKKDLNIGTAKIDLSKTDVPHHLIDFLNADENYSIKDFQDKASILINDIISRGKVPVIVGGTGLYINALIYNYHLIDDGRDPNFSKKYDNYTNHQLYELLVSKAYEQSLTIHENNRRRVLRALELVENGNSICHDDKEMVYDAKIICLNTSRDILYQRINERVDLMLNNGWIDECSGLMNKNYDLSKIKDIGYQEIFAFLDGKIDEEEMRNLIKQKTRNYAKRQMTWFKNKLPCEWIDINYDNPKETLEEMINIINKFLNKQ